MKHLLHICLTLAITCYSFHGYAQLDNNTKGGSKKGGKSLGIIAPPAKKVTKPKGLDDPKNTSGFKNAHKKQQEKYKKKQKKIAFDRKGVLSQAKLNEERFHKNFKKINGKYPKIDQDLGSFRTKGKSVKILCRDYQYPDGDRVTIYVNDIPVVYNITLKQSYQVFEIPLDKVINKIHIKALNQGSSGPNTAAFKIYGKSGNLLSSNEWNLATGAKATLIITRDE